MKVADLRLIDDVMRDLDKALEELQLGNNDQVGRNVGYALDKLKELRWDSSQRQ